MYSPQKTTNIIKEQAKKQNISINQLLLNCELGKNTITKMSNGTDILTQNFQKIADNLDCSVDFLLGRTKTSRLIKDIPDKIIDIVTEQYSKNPKEFISDDFIKRPNKAMKNQVYSFCDDDYDDYANIFYEAYDYAHEKEIDMKEITGIGSKQEYLGLIEFHDEIIPRLFVGNYYTLTQENYNLFRGVYRLYCKSYSEYVKNLLNNAE